MLYDAAASECGIVVECSDVTRALQLLQSTRRNLKDPVLNPLMFRRAPDEPHQLWIIKCQAE